MLHFRTFNTYSMCAICTHTCTLLVHFTRLLYTYLLLKIYRVYVYQLSYFMLCICLMLPTIKSLSIIKSVYFKSISRGGNKFLYVEKFNTISVTCSVKLNWVIFNYEEKSKLKSIKSISL